MNKNILVISIAAAFILIAISFASAVSSNNAKTNNKKESPLFGIRTRRAIVEKLGKIIENIKTKFIGDRLFFLPFLRSLQHLSIRQRLAEKTSMGWANGCFTC